MTPHLHFSRAILHFLLGLAVLFGVNFGIGNLLVGSMLTGLILLAVAIIAFASIMISLNRLKPI